MLIARCQPCRWQKFDVSRVIVLLGSGGRRWTKYRYKKGCSLQPSFLLGCIILSLAVLEAQGCHIEHENPAGVQLFKTHPGTRHRRKMPVLSPIMLYTALSSGLRLAQRSCTHSAAPRNGPGKDSCQPGALRRLHIANGLINCSTSCLCRLAFSGIWQRQRLEFVGASRSETNNPVETCASLKGKASPISVLLQNRISGERCSACAEAEQHGP